MGTELKFHLIPEDRTYVPTAEQCLRTLEVLQREQYLAQDCEHFVENGSTWISPKADAIFAATLHNITPLEGAIEGLPSVDVVRTSIEKDPFGCLEYCTDYWERLGLKYPLNIQYEFEEAFVSFGFEFCREYAYRVDGRLSGKLERGFFENLLHGPPTRCKCGMSLEIDVRGWDQMIYRRCPKCGTPFDPEAHSARLCDTAGNWSVVRGGSLSRFAFVVDFQKSFPRGQTLSIRPELLELVGQSLSCKLRSFAHWY